MLDIHTHLFWESYDDDRDEVVSRARAAGITRMICVGTSPSDNTRALSVAERYENVFASVGFHPHSFDKGEVTNVEWLRLSELAQHQNVVAIGECGLDYFVREHPVTDAMKTSQKAGFLKQAELARVFELPLIIHTRPSQGTMDAYQDIFSMLSKDAQGVKAILHCYQGDAEMTKKFLTLPQVLFSFAGNITYSIKKSVAGTKNDPAETLTQIPLDRLFVETDSPFLTPEPYRGTRNEPAFVMHTAKRMSTVKNVSLAVLSETFDANFMAVFHRAK